MAQNKTISILEDAMGTLNQVLTNAAATGDLDSMETIGGIMIDMAKVTTDLFRVEGLNGSMAKLHELATSVKESEEVPPDALGKLGACLAPLPFMAASAASDTKTEKR